MWGVFPSTSQPEALPLGDEPGGPFTGISLQAGLCVDSHTMHQAGWLHVILTDAERVLFSKGSLHFKVMAGKGI